MIQFISQSTYKSGAASTSHSFSHESTGFYRGLVVNLVDYQLNWNTLYPTSVTANGVEMLVAQSDSFGGDARQYYLPNPTQGMYNIVVTFAASSNLMAFAYSYTGVDQASMLNTAANSNNSGGTVTVSLTTTLANCWAVTLGYDTAGETVTAGTSFVLRNSAGDVNVRAGDSNGIVPTGAFNVTVGVGSSTGDGSALVSAIAPATLVPVLDETVMSNLALRTATASDEVLYDGEATVTARGFVYSTTPIPTLANSVVTTSGTVGAYSVGLTGLSVNTTYYIRSYATNANGTTYGTETSFTTLNIGQYELQKEIDANEGETFLGRITVTGTTGTVTVKLGTTGTSTVINAGSGISLFSGTYSGESGLIITRSANFNGTIDDVYYVSSPLTATVDWSLDTLTLVTAIDSSVFFKRIENEVFNSFAFYRYLDLLFKDLDGFVTVTIRDEREDVTSERTKVFSVGNTEPGTVSPFQKKKISFLIKNQAVIIGLSNANVSETFSIAQFLLTGHKKPERMFSPGKIVST